jgi:hypothetical protein
MYSTDQQTKGLVYLTQEDQSAAYRSIPVWRRYVSELSKKVSRHVTVDQHCEIIVYHVHIVWDHTQHITMDRGVRICNGLVRVCFG